MTACLKCPVTALKCHGTLLLTGQKSRIVIYAISNGKMLFSEKAFATSSIHRFCAVNNDSILVIGGKSMRVIKVERNDENLEDVSVTFSSVEKILNGWVWDGILMSETKYALITAHNTVVLWDSVTNEHQATSSCEEQCILYSALIQKTHNAIVVAAGTVFNQLLLWKPNVDASVAHTFQETWKIFHGHEGVIFRIRFNPSLAHLLSVSDDRSIRVWDIEKETCLQVLFGHTARVWDAIFTQENIVSVGEDAACIVWNKSGSIVKKFTGHKGKSIWSMDVNEKNIFTGGGDGAIRQWPLSSKTSKAPSQAVKTKEFHLPRDIQERSSNMTNETDYPRVVKIQSNRKILMFTNNGLLVSFEEDSNVWTVLHEDSSFSSYCVFELQDRMVALGNLYGTIKIFSLDNPNTTIQENIFDGKIFSISWLCSGSRLLLLVTGLEGVIKLYEVDCKMAAKMSHLSTFLLPHSKQRWVTDAIVVGDDDDGEKISSGNSTDISLVCGDRRGSLHLFNTCSQDPIHSMLGVHGKTGVTSVMYKDGMVYSTGRDGSFRKYSIQNESIILIDKQKACKGMDWIEGIWFHDDDVIVYGFYMQSHFALWSFHSNEVLFKEQCGGGYRSWHVQFPSKTTPQLKFSYLKGPALNTVDSDWRMNEGCTIMQDKLHGREILCAKVIGVDYNNSHWLLATSSEDTTIKFLIYDTKDRSLTTLYTAVGHVGGVKDIAFVPYSSAKCDGLNGMFISCGSRTSLKIWKFKKSTFSPYKQECCSNNNNTDDVVLTDDNSSKEFSCCLSHEIYNPEMNPKQLKSRTGEFIDDMRYLSCDAFELSLEMFPRNVNIGHMVCCISACSDGVARVYVLQDDHPPQLLVKLGDNRHCVQQARFERRRNEVFVFITATDGLCLMWNITGIIRDYTLQLAEDDPVESTNGRTTYPSSSVQHVNRSKYKFHEIDEPLCSSAGPPSLRIRKHQSGINTLDVLQTDTGFLVATGGDDNALCVVVLSKDDQTDEYHVTSEYEQLSAHISSITGVRFVSESLLITTSIDQRVKFWNIKDLSHPVNDIFTDVADVSNLEIWKQKDVLHIAVTGVGMEILTVNSNGILLTDT